MAEDYGLDLHASILLEEFRERRPLLEQLQKVVMEMLRSKIKDSGLELNAIESRIKEEKSLVGKLQRKGHKYHSIKDITDLFGARIVTFYNEDVDRIASMAETLFSVDWANSVDKRKMHEVTSFGYNSLHYICRLPKELYDDPEYPELNDIPFELQMRTALQHVWSAIQHDIGYKSDVEIPLEYHRNFSRLAGLLELADNEFSRVRIEVSNYRRRATALMNEGRYEEVLLDGDTFNAYLLLEPFDKLNQQIAAITMAELHETSYMPYLHILHDLGLKTLADVERFQEANYDDAYQLALFQLGATDIDILSSTIGLQNLCIVSILKAGGGQAGLCRFFDGINGPSPNNEDLARIVMGQAKRLAFMNQE